MADEHNHETPDGYVPGSDADIHISSIAFVGIIGSVLTVVIVLVLKALYFSTVAAEIEKKQGQGADVHLSDLRSSQIGQIGSHRWVDPRTGTVGLPIEEAMALVLAEQAGRPNNGIEITNWDHYNSDQQPTPGNLVLLGQEGLAPKPRPRIINAPPVHGNEALENMSGSQDVDPDALAETSAEKAHGDAEEEGTAAHGGSE